MVRMANSSGRGVVGESGNKQQGSEYKVVDAIAKLSRIAVWSGMVKLA